MKKSRSAAFEIDSSKSDSYAFLEKRILIVRTRGDEAIVLMATSASSLDFDARCSPAYRMLLIRPPDLARHFRSR
jgi:hypothetical protein